MLGAEKLLVDMSRSLDISPSDYKKAQQRFGAVKDHLLSGTYNGVVLLPEVYLQGSFRLGTVVRPYYKDRDGDFDIDQVVEFRDISNITASNLKKVVGDRLKENANYARMLDEEGKRCWTLLYKEQIEKPGFHIDVLPSTKSTIGTSFQINITHKENNSYSWRRSNPNGYYRWFKSKNQFTPEFIKAEKSLLLENNRGVYNSVEDVPIQLLRSPLQRAIQIMKRHRDVYFSNKENKPISIIITTITASVKTENNISGIIDQFLKYVSSRYQLWVANGHLDVDGILDHNGSKWIIPNPVDRGLGMGNVENFADKWEKNPDLAHAFFDWVQQFQRDYERFSRSGLNEDLNLRTSGQSNAKSYPILLKESLRKEKEQEISSNLNLLSLIHLGIEQKVDWSFVEEVAQREYDIAKNEENKDVAAINFYQVSRHRGFILSSGAVEHIRAILGRHASSARYIMCCNLLLGTATYEMIRRCVQAEPYQDVLRWPILRLFRSQQVEKVAVK